MRKTLLSLLLITLILLGVVFSVPVSTSAAELFGDVDNDEDVNIIDVTMIQRFDAHIIPLDEMAQYRGDVDADGDLTIIDATLIQRYLVNIITEFPAGEYLPTEAPTIAPTEAPTEPEDVITKVKDNIPIYFTNNKNWANVYAYLFNSKTGAKLKAWPGTKMTNPTTNDYGEKIYSMTVNVTQYDRVIYNNGSSVQTTDLPVTKASSGYFIHEDLNGKYLAGVYPYGQDGEGTIKTVSFNYPDGYKKNVYVWLPEGYNANDKTKKYSVLYMCDGQNLFGQATTLSGYEWECDESVLSLMQNGGDGVIVVGVACGSTDARRNHELTPNLGQLSSVVSGDTSYQNGGGKVFSDFVTDTVIPYVESNYNVNSIRGIAGSSSGGIEAFYIGMENMDKFRYIGALSPAFILYDKRVWDNYLNTKDFTGEVPRVYFFCGNSVNDQLEQALYPNATAMQGWLTNHGYPTDKMTTVTDAEATHSEGFWALYFPEMLSWCMDL